MKLPILYQITRRGSRNSTIILIWLMLVVLSACEADMTPTVTPSPEPPPLQASPTVNPLPPTPLGDDFSNLPHVGISNPTAAAQANNADLNESGTLAAAEYSPELLVVNTASGSPLNAELYIPDNLSSTTPTPGVVIVSGQFNDWRGFPLTLREAGIIVLQVETRIPALEGDASATLNTLATQLNVDSNRLAVIAAEEGAVLALQGCAEDARCLGAAVLTPSGQAALTQYMPAFGSRELWIAVSEEDNASVLAAEAVRQSAAGTVTVQSLREAGRGTQILFTQPAVDAMLVNWLLGLLS